MLTYLRRPFLCVPILLAIASISDTRAQAQAPRKYPVQIEVLIQPLPAYRLHTQKWGQVFYEMQRRATFRSGRTGEKTRVEESETGAQESVTAIGIMNRNGSITFRNQTFTITNPKPLIEWLEELEKYGAKGPPNESSTWGLNDKQFADVLKALSQRVTEPVSLTSVEDAIASLDLPNSFRIEFTAAGRQRAIRARANDELAKDFKGLTKGSVLAATLARFGLGFRPKADDGSGFIIEIDAGNESSNLYPVGWQNNEPITLVVPELAKTIPVGLNDVPLDALIADIARKLKLPHFYSTFEIAASGKDVTKIKYSRKPDRITPYELMSIVSKTHHLGLSLRTDEAGNVFLWITTEDDYQAFRKRFAHAAPKP